MTVFVAYLYDYLGSSEPKCVFETRESAESWKKTVMMSTIPSEGDWLPEYKEVDYYGQT
jgi:hypothetical protein